MRLRDTLRIVGWLIRDTFRQSLESRVCWWMLGITGLTVLLCLSVGVSGGAPLHRADERPDFLPRGATDVERSKATRDGVDIPSGTMSLAFGAFRIPLDRDAADAVHFLQLILAAAAADTAGLLLALVWTAGFLPAFLAPGSVAVLLAKPVPRGLLIVGKYLGVLTFVAAQAAAFFLATWAALGVRTGIWTASYLWGAPLLLLQFSVFYGVAALIAADRRRTVSCLLGAMAFWLLCWGMNYGRHAVVAMPHMSHGIAAPSAWLRGTVEAGYWVLPKPADSSILLGRAINAGGHLAPVPEFEAVQRIHEFHPILSVATSLAFGGLLLTLAARRFAATDY